MHRNAGRTFAFLAGATCLGLACAADPGDPLKTSNGAIGSSSSSSSSSGGSGSGSSGIGSSSGTGSSSSGVSNSSSGGSSSSSGGNSSSNGGSTSSSGTGSSGASSTGSSSGSSGDDGPSVPETGPIAPEGGASCITAPCATLKIQWEQQTSAANTIPANINITNTGSAAIDLANVRVHYYFTAEGDTSLAFNCDYAGPYNNNVVTGFSSSSVSSAFVPMGSASMMYADTYLELSFASTSLPPNLTVSVSFRIHDASFAVNYDQTNDWSHFSSPISTNMYNDADYITAYLSGTLAWGIEPGALPPPRDGGRSGDASGSSSGGGRDSGGGG